jgi:hypothetical protein
MRLRFFRRFCSSSSRGLMGVARSGKKSGLA